MLKDLRGYSPCDDDDDDDELFVGCACKGLFRFELNSPTIPSSAGIRAASSAVAAFRTYVKRVVCVHFVPRPLSKGLPLNC